MTEERRETLRDLVNQAEAQTAKMSVRNPNRALLLKLCGMAVALAGRVHVLESQQAEKPLIVVP